MRGLIISTVVGVVGLGALPATATPIVFSSAVATYSQTLGGYPAADMINGNFSNANGWAIYQGPADEQTNPAINNTLSQTALFTLQTPLSAGFYDIAFSIYQLYYDLIHSLGDFSLGYTTDPSPQLTSADSLFSIASATSSGGTVFTSPSPGELLAGGSYSTLYTITVSVDSTAPITGIFLNVIDNPSNGLPTGGPGRTPANGNFVITQFTAATVDVPEPASILLFSTGLLGLVAGRRHLNKNRRA